MLQNYFKISFRYLIRNKGFSIVNISGLAIGMASAMLILLWVQNELTVDRFYKNTDRIYTAYRRVTINNEVMARSQTPQVLATALKQSFPEVEDAVRINNVTFLVTAGDKHLNAQGAFADSTFLTVFNFPFIQGNANRPLERSQVILTERFAKSLFGNTDAVGKTVRIDSADNFTVAAVLKDLPANTRFAFDYLLPWNYQTKLGWDDNNWTNNSTDTYVLLKPGASKQQFDAKIKKIIMQHAAGTGYTTKVDVLTQPLSRLYLYSKVQNGELVDGRIEVVRLFVIIATFILLIACINFMNLSTARSEKRAKEVGIRKVAGAHKSSLVAQFICESILLAFAAFLLALAIVRISLPAFNELIGKQLSVNFGDFFYWLAGVVVTGFAAGSYPAFYLSSFKPVKILKGGFKNVNALVTPRKVLVVMQFSFAVILIICTIIVRQQIGFAQQRDAGYDRGNLVYTFNQGDVNKNYDIIKQELLSSGAAISVTKSANPITQRWASGSGYIWSNSTEGDKKTEFVRMGTDADFIKTMGATLVQGRDIDIHKYPADSTAMLLNETAAKTMGLKNPVGQLIRRQNYPNEWRVVGVVKDFILESPYEKIEPTMIIGPLYWMQVIHFKLNPAHPTAEDIAEAEAIFRKYNPQYPFDYVFADDSYARKFADEQRTGKLAGLFAGLSIFISCLGLFGLAAYMAEQRTKEIGIRKVLGASVQSVVMLLSKDFVMLVITAVAIATPVAYYAMHQWLQNYSYHINISWWIFAMAGLIAVSIALVTVSFQAVKAALANPVKSLRAE